MSEVPGARTFVTSGQTYDTFMGRYSQSLAPIFADFAGIKKPQTALDVGCGPGALTGVLVERLGPTSVAALDPSPPFVDACASRFPTADVRLGRAEEIPFEDDRFDIALSQLVLHFVSDPEAVASELQRVVRPDGTVAACMWDAVDEMDMLQHFWDATACVGARPPEQARTLRFGGKHEIAELFAAASLRNIEETTLDVVASYTDFEDLWTGFLAGIGPAGSFCVSLSETDRAAVRSDFFKRVGSPSGSFSLHGSARAAVGQAT